MNVCFCYRLIVFLCRRTIFRIDLHSQVGLCIVVILRLLWAICPLISMNGQFSRRNHPLDSPGYYHNPMTQLLISVSYSVRERKNEKNGWCTMETCFLRVFNLLIQSKVLIWCFTVTNFTIRLNFWVIFFMNFCFHNPWWSLPFSSIVNVFAFSEGIRNIKKNFRSLRIKNCTNNFSIIIFKVKCLCFTQMCANIGIKIVISIISRAVVVNEVLNFMSVEEPNILWKVFMGQLVTVQVLQGNLSTEKNRKS